MKTKKIKQQVHGKVDGDFEITTLDQIWGSTGLGKYGTFDENEYSDQLKGMNKTDLQAHAAKMGILPIDNRERLVKSLIGQFKKHIATFQKPKLPANTSSTLPNQRILDILAEGR